MWEGISLQPFLALVKLRDDTGGSCLAQDPPQCVFRELCSCLKPCCKSPPKPLFPLQRWNLPLLSTGSPGAAGDGQGREVGVPGGERGSPALLRRVV